MKLWSVQKKEVVYYVSRDGVFQPDFSKSEYLNGIPNLQPLYYFLLEVFNRRSRLDVEVPGLIFCFAGIENQRVYEIQDIDGFTQLIQSRRAVVKDLWNYFKLDNRVILELDYENLDQTFDPILIDINDFQFIMPPIDLRVKNYQKSDVNRILNNIRSGIVEPAPLPSGIIQAHAPYIASENITNVFTLFDLI